MTDIKTIDAVPVEPVTDLKIIKNIQEFEWNLAEVKKMIEGNIQKYVGLVVTNENLKEMEQAQKEITSIRTKVDAFRKAVKKKMEEPYKLFEGEIKELLQLIEKAEAPLKDQTAKYEQERIAAKEIELNKFAQATALSIGVRNNYFNFAVQSSWTNRTAKDTTVRKEIVSLIETMLENQRRADELIEMEKQRVGLIEGQCIAHSVGLLTPVVPSDVNHLLVGVTLTEIPGIILAECKKRADIEFMAAAPKVVVPPVMPPQNNERFELGISFPNDGSECDMSCEDIQQQQTNYQEEYIPPAPLPPVSSEILNPAAFTLPPLPPVQRPMPPMPAIINIPPMAPQLFNCTIEFPNITAQEGAAIKEFLSSRVILFKIISQVAVGSEF